MRPNRFLTICDGAIPGLRLPCYAWHVLRRENILTLDQLKAVADRIERVYPGVGPKAAAIIRAELARIADPNGPPRS